MARRRRKRAYGAGQVVPPRVPGGPWLIRWREGARRRSKGGFATRELAERVLAKIAGDAAVGRAGLPADPRSAPTLAVLAEQFLDRRDLTHRAAGCDRYRWNKHLKPHFGHLKPGEVDQAAIRTFAEVKLAEGLAAGTVRVVIALLSGLFTDLVEQGVAQVNPAKGLPRSTRRLIKPTHDPRTTPFIEKLADVRRIYLALPEPLNVAYAIGAFAGLRTGEVLALKWSHVDLDARRIHVREQVTGQLKDKDSRMVPVLDALYPVLVAWKLKSGGAGLVVPPMRADGKKVDKLTPGNYLRPVLDRLGLSRPGLGWYQATRHTFASQWVLAGGSIEKLKEMLGHYSVVVTERYTHLRVDLFDKRDFSLLPLDASRSGRP
jgi:integrase